MVKNLAEATGGSVVELDDIDMSMKDRLMEIINATHDEIID